MAIFANNDKSVNGNSGNTSIISQGTRIKGDVYSECNLHIDGDLEGNIIAKTNVAIGKSGNVNGSIDADHLFLLSLYLLLILFHILYFLFYLLPFRQQ